MKTPWHLWLIGIIALLWNAGGAYDYLMTQLDNESYLSMLTDAQRAMLDSRPTWFDAAWALGVWGSILGSLLLLARSRWAGAAFGVSILGLLASSVWSFALAQPPAYEVSGAFSVYFSVLILVILIALLAYSGAMRARGVLR